MRPLGIIGGVTWQATAAYYEGLNRGVAARLGPYRSAELRMVSLDYGAVRAARADGDWRPLQRMLVRSARALRRAGAEALVLTSNSLHGAVPAIEAESGLPVLHIADALAAGAAAIGATRLGFFGTGFTMGAGFMADRLGVHGLELVLPPDPAEVDAVIMDELAQGIVRPASRQRLLQQLGQMEVDAMVLGCTELPLLFQAGHVGLPVLDTVELHVDAAVDWLVGEAGHRA